MFRSEGGRKQLSQGFDAKPEHTEEERHDKGQLVTCQVRRSAEDVRGAEHDTGKKTKAVESSENLTDAKHVGQKRMKSREGEKAEEFSNEVGKEGKAEIGESEQEEERSKKRHECGEASVVVEEFGVCAVVKEANEKEQPGRHKSVGNHHESSMRSTGFRKTEESECDKRHVRNGRVGDDFFEIGLAKGGQGAEKKREETEESEKRKSRDDECRKQRNDETDESETAEFQENTGKKNTACGGSSNVGFRKPQVHRDERDFDSEDNEESPSEKNLRILRKCV